MTNNFLLGNSIVGLSLFLSEKTRSNNLTVHFFPLTIQFSSLEIDGYANSSISLWIFGVEFSVLLGCVPTRKYLAHLVNTFSGKE